MADEPKNEPGEVEKTPPEFTVDLDAITIEDWRQFWTPETDPKICDEIMSRAIGIPVEDIRKFSFKKYRRASKAIRAAAQKPDDSKN